MGSVLGKLQQIEGQLLCSRWASNTRGRQGQQCCVVHSQRAAHAWYSSHGLSTKRRQSTQSRRRSVKQILQRLPRMNMCSNSGMNTCTQKKPCRMETKKNIIYWIRMTQLIVDLKTFNHMILYPQDSTSLHWTYSLSSYPLTLSVEVMRNIVSSKRK